MGKWQVIDRDPRKDPRPGDVLRVRVGKSWWTRVVRTVGPLFRDDRPCVMYHHIATNGYNLGSRTCLLAAWRRWAKGAEVVKIGGET